MQRIEREREKESAGLSKRSVTAGVNKPAGVVETASTQPGAANRFEKLDWVFFFCLFPPLFSSSLEKFPLFLVFSLLLRHGVD